MRKRCALFVSLLVCALPGCGGGDDPAGPGTTDNIPAALRATFGSYDVTYTATISKHGGPPEPVPLDKAAAAIEISGSQPGVMGVDPGTVIPGVAPEDVIFGAAYVQNPVHVFMGTASANQHGDFGIWSSVWIGLPPDPVDLEYVGCGGQGFFSCSPIFFQHAESTDAVNLIYYAVGVEQQQNGDVTFSGFLADDHRSEAAAANGFSILATNDILGTFVDQYIFDEGATFSFTVSNDAISGSCVGTGRSLVGSEPDPATFRITFGGNKLY